MNFAINFLATVSCLAVGGTMGYAAPQHGSVQENIMKGIGRIFEQADANHDGVLTRKEAEKAPMLSNYFNDMDINQDGKVTRQEMVALISMKQKHHGRNVKLILGAKNNSLIFK